MVPPRFHSHADCAMRDHERPTPHIASIRCAVLGRGLGWSLPTKVFACYEMWDKLDGRSCLAAPVVVYAVYKSLGDVWNKVCF